MKLTFQLIGLWPVEHSEAATGRKEDWKEEERVRGLSSEIAGEFLPGTEQTQRLTDTYSSADNVQDKTNFDLHRKPRRGRG